MRWKIKSVNTSIDKATGKKTTTETKQLMISIGDAVGVGKNAIGAVDAAARAIPSLAKSLPSAGLGPYVSSISILNTVVKGLDVYKGITRTVEMITPIVQLVARASGVWAAPGNAADIAQIIIGKVQKILISLAISGILKLKEMIWNYEFSLKEIRSDFVSYIDDNIKDLNKKLSDVTNLDLNQKANTDGILDLNGDIDLSNAIDWENQLAFRDCSSEFITEEINDKGIKRRLRGNLRNLGIQYSDDDGKTWKVTNQNIGSWKKFEKILYNGKYIYVAGGINYIETIKPAEAINPDTNYFYYDSSIEKIREYNYEEKLNLTLEKANVEDKYTGSLGIYYSEDGINWSPTNIENKWINDLCSFEEKTGSKATIVAATNDYTGSYYSEDGINWSPTNETYGKWLEIDACDGNMKIIKFIKFQDISKIYSSEINIGKQVKLSEETKSIANIKNMVIEKKGK